MFNQQSEVMWAGEWLLTQDEDTDKSVLIAVKVKVKVQSYFRVSPGWTEGKQDMINTKWGKMCHRKQQRSLKAS